MQNTLCGIRLCWTSGSLLAALIVAPPAFGAASFTLLEALPGDTMSTPTGLTPAGTKVVGFSQRLDPAPPWGNLRAFVWTAGVGLSELGNLPPNFTDPSGARGISADGAAIVGSALTTEGIAGVLWTEGIGAPFPNALPGAAIPSLILTGISADGATIVGEFDAAAFRWTAEGGIVSLGDLPGGEAYSSASAVSADGSTIVGFAAVETGLQAMRWTAAGGMSLLADFPDGFESFAHGVSADGSTIVGASVGPFGEQAFRWTVGGGIQSLGALADTNESLAAAVSEDGATIVGVAYSPRSDLGTAFIWDSIHGMRRLSDVLKQRGVSLTYPLLSAGGISPDGRFIIGIAGVSQHVHQAFLADLGAPIPEPNAAGMALVLAACLLGARRRAAGNDAAPIRDIAAA